MTTMELKKLPYPLNLLNSSANRPIADDTPLEFETPLSDDQLKGLEYVLSFLTDKEQKVLKMYFEERKSLKDIGQIIGLTQERIRQIKAKGLRKLRHPMRYAYILNGYEGETSRRAEKASRTVSKINKDGRLTIAELDLSVRSYNSLRRAGLAYADEVFKKFEDGSLSKIRNLGAKSILNDVLPALMRHGYKVDLACVGKA